MTKHIWISPTIELEQDSPETLIVLQACGARSRAEAEYAISIVETETPYHAIKRGTGWEIV